MFSTKLKVAGELVLVLGLVGTGAGVFARSRSEPADDQGPAAAIITTTPIAPATDSKELVARITDHINGNYAHLRTRANDSPDDKFGSLRDETGRSDQQASQRIDDSFVRQPSSVRRERVLMSGEDLLREAMDEDGGIWSFHHGVFTQCLPKEKAAWLRSREQMPGMFPLDPRDIASTDVRWLFVDLLRGDRVLEVGQARTLDGQPRMALLMEHAFDPEHKERYRCEFDTARNDLPTRIVYLRDEDRIGVVLDISYQEVIPGKAWFLKKATRKFFDRDRARTPDSEAWRQALIVETMGNVLVNRPIPDDAFIVNIPPGTRVSDAVRSSSRRTAENQGRK